MQGLDAFDSGAGDLPEFFSMDAHPHSSAQEDVSLGGWEQDPLAHEPQTDEGTPPPHNAGAMAATGGAAMDDQAATGFAAAAAAEYLTPAEIRWKMSEERPLFMEWIKVRPLCASVLAATPTECSPGRIRTHQAKDRRACLCSCGLIQMSLFEADQRVPSPVSLRSSTNTLKHPPNVSPWQDALVEVHGGTRDGRKLLNLKVRPDPGTCLI